MKLYNSLTRRIESLSPINPPLVTIYSCGPTVYDRVHIGNLSAFITADVLRRILITDGYTVKHVMNLTDVDDKTIKKSRNEYPDLDPQNALNQTTNYYAATFFRDSEKIGNDIQSIEFVKATDPTTISSIQEIIKNLHTSGVAYIADDGIYFSISAYREKGNVYGQLVDLSTASTSMERIRNDEYDKDSMHDFALWKFAKPGEPTWTIELDGRDYSGRPGWHIECSAMTKHTLGDRFDIHTGGIDLKFPHHENEIAQSTACSYDKTFAKMFVHNEHMLVDGHKMSKSLGNFYTLEDIIQKGYSPLAFRMLVLQSHYQSPTNFNFEALDAAAARLDNWRSYAALRHQTHDTLSSSSKKTFLSANRALVEQLLDNIGTPQALAYIDETLVSLDKLSPSAIDRSSLTEFIETIDNTLGLNLLETTPDVDDDTKRLIVERERAREQKDWLRSDQLRDTIMSQSNIKLIDTPTSTIWRY